MNIKDMTRKILLIDYLIDDNISEDRQTLRLHSVLIGVGGVCLICILFVLLKILFMSSEMARSWNESNDLYVKYLKQKMAADSTARREKEIRWQPEKYTKSSMK